MKVGWLEQVVFVYSFHHNKPTDITILQFETAFEIAGTNCINRGENKRRRFWSNWGSWSEVTKPDFQFHSLVFLIIWTSSIEHVCCPGIGSEGECTTRASWRARRPSWGSCRSPTEIWSELSSSRWVLSTCPPWPNHMCSFVGDLVSSQLTLFSQLTMSNDESLQCLSFRLDFNQHYKKRDSRLSKPLTFSHRWPIVISYHFPWEIGHVWPWKNWVRLS